MLNAKHHSPSRPRQAAPAVRPGSPYAVLRERERQLRRWTEGQRRTLRRERWLRLHVFLIALLTLGALMLGGLGLQVLGVESLALRYALLLPLTYGLYLGLLRLWAGHLLSQDSTGDPLGDALANGLDAADLASAGVDAATRLARGTLPALHSGGGGDFGAGGASGSWNSTSADALADCLAGTGETLDSGGGVLGSAGDALGSSLDLDEGVVVAVPLLLILAIAAALGAGVFLLFGVDILLAVCVEVALASAAGGLAWRCQREGWWRCALRRTWAPALGLLVMGLALGWSLDHWVPEARSLPHAWELVRVR